MEYVAATRNTDSRVRLVQTRLVEIDLMDVQNRTKTVHAKAKAPERRAKFDPVEAMSQLNRIGHDFSRVQVGKGRFTYKCRVCFLRGGRSFLKQLFGKPCSSTSRDVVPLPAPVSVPTLDEPETFFIGDTPPSEDDPFGWGGDFAQDHQAMSDQELPFGPVGRMESADMDLRLSVYPTCGHAMEDAELADCASGSPDALCCTVEQASAVKQASEFQGYVEVDDVAAADSGSSGTVDYTRNDTAGTMIDPGTMSFVQPRTLNGTEDIAEQMEAQTASIPNPANMAVEPTPGTVNARERSRSPRRHEEEQKPFGLTSVHLSHQFGFRDVTLWCWRCGGWSAGSRRASRLKDPCGIPTKTGADVVNRVSGGYPPKAHVWRSDDVSGAPERILKNLLQQEVQTTSPHPRRQFHMSWKFLLCQFCWSSADQGTAYSLAPFSQVVAVPFSCPLAKCA